MEDGNQLWKRCTASLREQVSEATWQMWLSGIELLSPPDPSEPGVIVLGVPNTAIRERVASRFLPLIEDTLRSLSGHPVQIRLQVLDQVPPPIPQGDTPQHPNRIPHPYNPSATPDTRPSPSTSNPGPDIPSRPTNSPDTPTVILDPRFTFDTFVAASSNRLAYAAAQAVAETPGRSYNPLFIYGDSGLGKTHLLHAIGNYVRENFPHCKVLYVTTETFLNEFIDSIRMSTQMAFKRRYRQCDVLLIDDVQFMENKEGLQDEFFHTFNDIHGAGKQVVLTCDRPPKSIETLEDRLRSRFLAGLITEIDPPDLETRLAILRSKAEADRDDIPDDVLELIATHVKNNIRELEGALIRVTAFASLNHEPISLSLAERVLSDILSSEEPRRVTPQMILEATANSYGFTVEALCGPSRTRPLVTARQVAMYLVRNLTDYSYPAIARIFGGRDHTTVIHAVEKITNQMKERRQIYQQVTDLLLQLKSGT